MTRDKPFRPNHGFPGVVHLRDREQAPTRPRVLGVGRDADNAKALCVYFDRALSDDEMRFLHDVLCRAAAMRPLTQN